MSAPLPLSPNHGSSRQMPSNSISSVVQEQDDTMRLDDFESFKKQFKSNMGHPSSTVEETRPRSAILRSKDKMMKMLRKKSSFEIAQETYEQKRQELAVRVESPTSPPPNEPLPTLPPKPLARLSIFRRPDTKTDGTEDQLPRHLVRIHQSRQRSFKMALSNFLSSRFWAATVAFYVLAWIVTLAGLAATQSTGTGVGGLVWFALVLSLCLLLWVIVAISQGTGQIWNRSLTSILLISVVLNLIFAEQYRTSSQITDGAVLNGVRCHLAGLVLQLMVQFPWLLMLGSHPEGFPALLGDYTMHSGEPSNIDTNVPLQSINSPTLTTATKTSASGNKNKTSRPTTPLNTTGTGGLPLATPQAPLLARALYTYKANPDDPNELSFDKGEMLEIIDNRGKWWQLKRRDGNGVAIAPSNYLQLVT